MAQRTRGAAIALIQQLTDDTAAKLWSAANVLEVLSGTVDELWGELFDYDSHVRSTETVGTLVAPGSVDTAALTPRFYRLQSVVRNNRRYTKADQRDIAVANGVAVAAPDYTYAWFGDELHLFPYDATTPVFIKYCSLPLAVADLANDNAAIVWPDGYHMAYIYTTAARLMEKGDRESSERFQNRANEVMARLRARLRKRDTNQLMPYSEDNPLDWGGV